ncbi:MAG: hypothetical protein JO279_07290 [Verrucomicrobia bacterium]|nr:hypothetical protein [Verrucomicrobiota bacterium]
MAAKNRGGGCGCCGCLLASLLVLLGLILLGVGFVYFSASTSRRNNAVAPGGQVVSFPATFIRQTYLAARQKFNQFFADPAERRVAFSNSEVNALLAASPELRNWTRGTAVVLNQDSADVSCSWPLDLPFLPRRYLSYAFQLRPSMRGDQLVLDVLRIEEKGIPLKAAETRQYQRIVVPLMEQALSTLNKVQGDRSVHEVRIENGNLILAR